MQLSNFDYILPNERIAQNPAEPRDSAKLLHLSRQTRQIEDMIFRDIEERLGKNDVIVVNETHVIPARLKGMIVDSDTLCEIFLHTPLGENVWDCLVYPGKKLKLGKKVVFHDTKSPLNPPLVRGEAEGSDAGGLLTATIQEISEKGRIVAFDTQNESLLDIVDKIGEIPLPPYIKDSQAPDERYQTVYHNTQKAGSVAAPTAGLHFTPELLKRLIKKGVQIEKVCLHVGLGTFGNVETDTIEDHHMHSEYIEIDSATTERLNNAKAAGKRIIAVGTTSVRTLESMSDKNGKLNSGGKDTDIFIYPGYRWRFVDSIITNFHLPKSTLLMLVSSFAGDENRKKAYQHAIDHNYRFFSFGDAMWID